MGRGVQSSRFARPFFPFPSSFSSPSGNGAFTDKRSLLAAGVALVERDEAVFGPPTLFSSDSFSLSLSLVTRNRSRLIVKKKEKKESLVSVDTRLLLRSSSVRVRLSVKNKATTAAPGLMMIFLSPLVPSYALLSLKSMDARCSWRLVEWFFFLLFFFSTIPGERKRI